MSDPSTNSARGTSAGPTARASSNDASERPACLQAASSVTCQECVDFLIDYLEGLLPDDQRFKFDSHLALCPDCETYLANYRKTIALSSGLLREDPTMPGPVPQGLVDAILKARKHTG